MTIEYDENGISIQTLSEILDEREVNLQEFMGADFNISGDNAVANIQLSDANREQSLQELLLFISSQLDPSQAEGIWLDYIVALNNISRYRPTKTTIPITVIGIVGASKLAGEITIVDETTGEYYTNQSSFEIETLETVNTIFECTSLGPIEASSSSTYSLKTPSIGVTDVEYNASGTYTIGRDTETDIELKARREQVLEGAATSTLESIKSAVSQVDGVTYLNAYENDTLVTADTIPGKAFEIVVEGGDDTEIAEAINTKRPTGIQAYGTTVVTLEDDDGNETDIGFTRATDVPIEMRISFESDEAQSQDWKDTVKDAIVEQFISLYDVGSDVYVFNLYCVLNEYPEITNVTVFEMQRITGGSWSDSVIIAKREVATLLADNITMTQV